MWITKKLKENKEREKKREEQRSFIAQTLLEIADSLSELNRNITENTGLLQPMVENLAKFLEVQLAATEQSLKNYKNFQPTKDDLTF